MYLRIDDDKLLEKYKTIWINIEDLQNIDLDILPVYDDGYIKTKMKTYGDKIYTNFRGWNAQENGVECESFTVISIDSLLILDNTNYLQVSLDMAF